MIIAHLFLSFPNKYQPYNEKLIDRMQSNGIQCYVFSFMGSGKAKDGFIDQNSRYKKFQFILKALTKFRLVSSFKRKYGYSYLNALKLIGRFSHILDKSADLIHIHHIQLLSADLLNYLEYFKLPWVISLRGFEISIRPLFGDAEYQIVRERLLKATGIHAVAQDLRQRAIKMGVPEKKIYVIRRTVEIDKPIISRANFSDKVIHLTTIGRFNWKKGLIFLLQCVALLKQRQRNIFLNICGSGSIHEESEILYWIWLLKIKDSIKLHGFLSSESIDSVLTFTHIYVQPSINEGIPNTLMRALASRIPIVASEVDGIPEIIENNVNGLLVPPGNAEALANAIERIISDNELRDRMVNSSLKKVSLDFSKEIDEYQIFYERMISDFEDLNHLQVT